MSLDGHSDSDDLFPADRPQPADRPLAELIEERWSGLETMDSITSERPLSPTSSSTSSPTSSPTSPDADYAATQFEQFQNSLQGWPDSDDEDRERESTLESIRREMLRRHTEERVAEERVAEERVGFQRYNFEWTLSGDAGLSINIFRIYSNTAADIAHFDSIFNQVFRQMNGVRPAEKDTIDSLPKVEITQEQVDQTFNCAICLLDFQLSELVKQLGCTHQFHGDCIDKWLSLKGNCPICRADLTEKAAAPKESSPLENEEESINPPQNFPHQFPSPSQ